ncbi:SAM-dependent methyltransferase [Amorphoplanes nipponensis]|uniref:S-adenosyl methyltransferase n=1 Tax=Actinoplanes nipponensis TaxID=135950 RepID=A0A919JLE5_9ACTN|nr:SAM-dependent methyltransferase [Actinoplanes nipponensis]GIE51490.1 hypothetical protein Ani05nite_50240 [Actinoplanes nipponensis]
MTQDSTRIDTSAAHPARRYNYWLGGKDNFAADRASADAIEREYPDIRTAAVQNRRFLQRAVRFLTAEAGIRQFLDIGTGLPTADNTHEVAQQIALDSRIVYVDNDPLVLAHARALLTSSAEGRTEYIEADLHDPRVILDEPRLRKTLDLQQPVALMLVAVLHFVADYQQARSIVAELLAQLAPGSYLVASHATGDFLDEATRQKLSAYDFVLRDRDQFTGFLDGLELIDPGITPITSWRPGSGEVLPTPQQASVYGAVARVPGSATARHLR